MFNASLITDLLSILGNDKLYDKKYRILHRSLGARKSGPRMVQLTLETLVAQNLKEPKKDGGNPKHNGISPRSSGSLFGLGIGANLLDVHAGAGIGHGRGGYGDMGQGFVGKPAGGHYPQQPRYPQFPWYPQHPRYPGSMETRMVFYPDYPTDYIRL
ncbi:hypothetical protein J6590_102459 [Homalodisca vitripennis]|nr:hypothetical protein J6590_102459 [Homalodisca vitripennis]